MLDTRSSFGAVLAVGEMANFSLIWRSRGRILTHSMHADLISESHLILICMLQKVPLAATIR
jgi:hypothetical protein